MNTAPNAPRGPINPDLTRGSTLAINRQSEASGDADASSGSSAPLLEDPSSRTLLEDAILAGAPDSLPLAEPELDAAEEQGALVVVEDVPEPNSHCPIPPTGIRSVCGRRKEMEDAVCVAHSFLSRPFPSACPDLHFFGVYDGHGGAQAAMHCREHLHLALAEEVLRSANSMSIEDREGWESSMRETFLRMDRDVGSRSTLAGVDQHADIAPTFSDTVGSTAVVAVLSCHHIIVANCGDSRAVLCRRGQAIVLSQDHKPDREDEMARIEAAGGRVIYWNGPRVLGVLAMSRAIGDHFLKPFVIADPDVTMTARSEEDECLILASDGLWDVVSNQYACTIASTCLAANRPVQTAALALAQKAHERGSSDNISVVVVDLRQNTGRLP